MKSYSYLTCGSWSMAWASRSSMQLTCMRVEPGLPALVHEADAERTAPGLDRVRAAGDGPNGPSVRRAEGEGSRGVLVDVDEGWRSDGFLFFPAHAATGSRTVAMTRVSGRPQARGPDVGWEVPAGNAERLASWGLACIAPYAVEKIPDPAKVFKWYVSRRARSARLPGRRPPPREPCRRSARDRRRCPSARCPRPSRRGRWGRRPRARPRTIPAISA